MDRSTPPSRPALDAVRSDEPPASAGVRRFLVARGVKEHNHASEIARIIAVDRSQSYRRLKGDVAWSHTDLRAIARHFGAPEDLLLPGEDAAVRGAPATPPPAPPAAGAEPVPAAIRVPRLPATGLLVPGAALAPDERCDLVAVHGAAGWEVWPDGDAPAGAARHAIEALTLRSTPRLQVALLEDDGRAAAAMVEALQPLGIEAEPHAGADSLLATIGHRRFDAYVLDWLLPDGNAARVVAAIRLHRPHAPVVVVTGALKADSEMERSLLELSVRWNFSTLDKPVRPMNLANAIKQLASAAGAA